MSLRFGRTTSLFVLIPAILFLSSCDSSGSSDGGPVILTTEITRDTDNHLLRYKFVSNEYVEGQLQDLRCDCQVDIGPFLEAQGFTKDEIMTSGVTGARLELLFPLGQQLDFLTEANVVVEGPKLTVLEIAALQGFPDAREASLQIHPDLDITSFLIRDNFEIIFQMNPDLLIDDELFELGLVLSIELVMEGL